MEQNETKKPRGRPKKTDSVGQLAQSIAIAHVGLAALLAIPELELAENESTALASSITRVIDEYGIEINSKLDAVIGLVVTSAAIYLPRAIAIKTRLTEAKSNDTETD